MTRRMATPSSIVRSLTWCTRRTLRLSAKLVGYYLLPWAKGADRLAAQMICWDARLTPFCWYMAPTFLALTIAAHALAVAAIIRHNFQAWGHSAPCVCEAAEQFADTGQTYILVIHKGAIRANMWTGIRSLIVSMSTCTHAFLGSFVLALAYPLRFFVIAVVGTFCAIQD